MAAYKKVFEPEQEPTRTVNTLWAFSRELRVGDIVIANRGWKQLVGIGRITGEYEYKPERGGYPHHRRAALKDGLKVTFPLGMHQKVEAMERDLSGYKKIIDLRRFYPPSP